MVTVTVIHNPSAGGARRLGPFLSVLRKAGFQPDVQETKERGDATRMAESASAAGASLVIASGGDGTIAEVVNGLAGSRTALAIFPAGTANVLARELGISGEPAQLIAALESGKQFEICLGALRTTAKGNSPEDEARPWYFTTMAGIGFDAHVVAGVNLGLKRAIGKGAYVWSACRELIGYQESLYRVTIDGVEYEASLLIVSNGRFYAGRYLVAPEAKLTEPEFHVGLLKKGGRRAILGSAWALGRGRLSEREDYEIVTGRKITVSGPVDDPVQADGDLVANLPVRIDVRPGALKLLIMA